MHCEAHDTCNTIEGLTPGGAAGLEEHRLNLADAVFVHLYLADMGSFAAANRAYARHFPAVRPAARACIQTPLHWGVPVAVDVLFRPGLPLHASSAGCILQHSAISTILRKLCI